MYEIFKQQEQCEKPKVVLIEGSPGMGKTTFCLKLSLDWSKGNTREPFPSFQLLLLLKCREMKTADIRDAIVEQLLPRKATEAEKDAFFQSIGENEPNVLVIFDGLDEINKEVALEDLVDPRKRSILTDSHVLVTSRHEAGLKVRKFCDALVEVVGFEPEDAEIYMAKYFEGREEMAENLMEKIEENGLKELITNPLNTALLCAVFEDIGDLPSTRSELYGKIILYILRRYFDKQKQEPPEEPLVACEKELLTLGKLAHQGIKEDKLSFNESDLKKEQEGSARSIAEMGFLSKEESVSKLDPKCLFTFFHKTFQEYFAAYYLSEQLVNAVVECKDFFREYSVEGLKFSQVFVFIAGILAGKGASARLVSFMASLSCSLSTLYPTTADEDEDEDRRQYEKQRDDVRLSFTLLCNCVAECSDGQQLNEFKKQMCAAIAENICWKELELWRTFNGESSVEYKVVCEVLKCNTTVKTLYLPGNGITDCSSLAEALKRNNTMETLDLTANQITDCSSLAEALKRNNTVKTLRLNYNPIRDTTPLQDLERHNEHLTLYYDR